MDKGKIIRILLALAATINDGAIMTGIAQFEDETANKIYAIASVIATFIAMAINHYYNNDYTGAGRIGTGITRAIKNEQKAGFVGERFFTPEPTKVFVKAGEGDDDVQDTEQ